CTGERSAPERRPRRGVARVGLDVEVVVVRDRVVARREHQPEQAGPVDRALDLVEQRVAVVVVARDPGLAAGVVDERHDVDRQTEGVARQRILGLAADPHVAPAVDAAEPHLAHAGGVQRGADRVQRLRELAVELVGALAEHRHVRDAAEHAVVDRHRAGDPALAARAPPRQVRGVERALARGLGDEHRARRRPREPARHIVAVGARQLGRALGGLRGGGFFLARRCGARRGAHFCEQTEGEPPARHVGPERNRYAGAMDLEILEALALSDDRSAAHAQLLPGSEDHDYYLALHAQHRGALDEADAVLAAWPDRHGPTPGYDRLRLRQLLLRVTAAPQLAPKQVAEQLRDWFGISHWHEAEVEDRDPSRPSRLPPGAFDPAALLHQAVERDGNLSQVT